MCDLWAVLPFAERVKRNQLVRWQEEGTMVWAAHWPLVMYLECHKIFYKLQRKFTWMKKINIPMFLLLLLLTVVFTRKTLSEVSQKNQQGQPMLTLKCLQVSRGGFEKPWRESLIRGQMASVGLQAPSFINFVAWVSYLNTPEAQFLRHSKGNDSVFFIGLLRRGLEWRIHTERLEKGLVCGQQSLNVSPLVPPHCVLTSLPNTSPVCTLSFLPTVITCSLAPVPTSPFSCLASLDLLCEHPHVNGVLSVLPFKPFTGSQLPFV